MTVFLYAIYRCAQPHMRPDELERARVLAALAETGEEKPRRQLLDLALDAMRRAHRQHSNKR